MSHDMIILTLGLRLLGCSAIISCGPLFTGSKTRSPIGRPSADRARTAMTGISRTRTTRKATRRGMGSGPGPPPLKGRFQRPPRTPRPASRGQGRIRRTLTPKTRASRGGWWWRRSWRSSIRCVPRVVRRRQVADASGAQRSCRRVPLPRSSASQTMGVKPVSSLTFERLRVHPHNQRLEVF
jgi:hypothetical protein